MTSKLESILVATDLSARCDRAFDRARSLARESGARLNILHVAEGDETAASEEKEAAARKQIGEDLGGDLAEIIVSYGPVPKTIARIAEETGSDLLVSGVARWNGINWAPLASAPGSGLNGFVYALLPVDDDLIVGGGSVRIENGRVGSPFTSNRTTAAYLGIAIRSSGVTSPTSSSASFNA